jgi:organic radical activating enzyme
MKEIINKYGITQTFFDRYFVKNGINAYAAKFLQFILWHRGPFLNPMHKARNIDKLIFEEIENFYNTGEFNIPMLQFVVTTRCTLNCRDCNALIPYFKSHGHVSYTLEEFRQDIDAICAVAKKIRRFILLGGEPLLHKDFPVMVEYCAQKPAIDAIEIITNGTLMPAGNMLDVLRRWKDKAYVHFSNYSKNKKLQNVLKYQDIKLTLKESGIKYQMADDLVWNREDAHLTDRGYSCDFLKKMYADCWFKGCLQAMNGKVCTCPRSSATTELYHEKIPYTDYINLRDSKDLKQEFIDFYHKNYVEACRYCVRTCEQVMPALQK